MSAFSPASTSTTGAVAVPESEALTFGATVLMAIEAPMPTGSAGSDGPRAASWPSSAASWAASAAVRSSVPVNSRSMSSPSGVTVPVASNPIMGSSVASRSAISSSPNPVPSPSTPMASIRMVTAAPSSLTEPTA